MKCESITEKEVIDVIWHNSGARTVDGVKRRVGCGLGRCQGSFCSSRIIKILARELDCFPEEICKDEQGSEILFLRLLNCKK